MPIRWRRRRWRRRRPAVLLRCGQPKFAKREDGARRDFLRRFYDIEDELPTHYDLVVNTDVLSVEEAARLVVQAASG
jgi:cytidylate kinase